MLDNSQSVVSRDIHTEQQSSRHLWHRPEECERRAVLSRRRSAMLPTLISAVSFCISAGGRSPSLRSCRNATWNLAHRSGKSTFGIEKVKYLHLNTARKKTWSLVVDQYHSMIISQSYHVCYIWSAIIPIYIRIVNQYYTQCVITHYTC